LSGDERKSAWRARELVNFTKRGDEGSETCSGRSKAGGSGEVVVGGDVNREFRELLETSASFVISFQKAHLGCTGILVLHELLPELLHLCNTSRKTTSGFDDVLFAI
jgi:hypothetical protein